TLECRIRRNIVVAEEIEPAAMKLIAARARNYIDRSNGGVAGRKIEIEGCELKLLHGLLGEGLSRAARDAVIDVGAVNRDAGQRTGAACDRDAEIVIRAAGAGVGVISHADSRLQ